MSKVKKCLACINVDKIMNFCLDEETVNHKKLLPAENKINCRSDDEV